MGTLVCKCGSKEFTCKKCGAKALKPKQTLCWECVNFFKRFGQNGCRANDYAFPERMDYGAKIFMDENWNEKTTEIKKEPIGICSAYVYEKPNTNFWRAKAHEEGKI